MEKRNSRIPAARRDYQGTLSPIRRLPVEMLIEIFRRTVMNSDAPSQCHINGFNVKDIEQGPWHLSQVCSLWRHTATKLCPDVWSRFTVEILMKEAEDDKKGIVNDNLAINNNMFALFECVLERSCGQSLDFSLRHWGTGIEDDDENDDDDDDDDDNEEVEDVYFDNVVMYRCFQLLLDQSPRWRLAELILSPSLLDKISFAKGRFDELEEIYLLCHEFLRPGRIIALETAPKLRVVHLANFDSRNIVTFPTKSLVSFYDDRPFPTEDRTSEYLKVIESSQRLLSFTYHHFDPAFQSDGKKLPLVENKSLQTLSASVGKLLYALFLLGLRNMTLTTCNTILGMFPCADDALFELHSLIVRSQCSLTDLCLVDVKMDEYLLQIIERSSKLETLTIQQSLREWLEGSSSTIKSLFRCMSKTIKDPDGHHTLVPSLKQLQITLNADHSAGS